MAESQAPEAALLGEVRKLNQCLDEVNAAVVRGRWISRLMMLLLVVAVVFSIIRVIMPIRSATQDMEPYQAALLDEFETRLQPALEAQLQEVLRKSGPEVFNLVTERMTNRRDDLMEGFEVEFALLLEELQEHGETTLTEQVVEFELKVREMLSEMAGGIVDDPDRLELVIGNGAVAIEQAVRRAVDQELADHINTLVLIEQTLLDFPVPAEIIAMDDLELSDYMVEQLGRYAVLSLKRNFTPETREFLRELAE